MPTTSSQFEPIAGKGMVTALLDRPEAPQALLVLAHGAGTDMRHAFMANLAARLAAAGIACLRYNFPYTERGSKRIDARPLLLDTVRAAVAHGAQLFPGLPLFAGGKSMGGRMTSGAAAEHGLELARGIVFFGFPLHPAGAPGTERGDHLAQVRQPLLFLQGTRDTLADLSLLDPICRRLPGATLHIVQGADHGFAVRKMDGRTNEQVMDELVATTRDWVQAHIGA